MAIDDLYRDVIMDHYKSPRNQGATTDANVVVEGVNPLCGDEIKLWLSISSDDIVTAATFEGHGCSISQASVSIMTEAITGKPVAEVGRIISEFRAMMLDGADANETLLGDGIALEGVRDFPVRIKCAVLSWNTLKLGLDEHQDSSGDHIELSHTES
jgi:nitrogen fixation NifU-like protein